MTKRPEKPTGPLFLGLEGGGTRTVAILADAAGKQLERVEASAGNARLLNSVAMDGLLASIARRCCQPDSVAIGLAGVRNALDARRIEAIASRIWTGVPCCVTSDLETAMAAANPGNTKLKSAQVLVLSGTGSCFFGRGIDGRTVRYGGWGHVLGDDGSAYGIALKALRKVVALHDEQGSWPLLGRSIMRRLRFSEPGDLITWAQSSVKAAFANVAQEVFGAAGKGDLLARRILAEAREELVRDAVACAHRTARRGVPVQFIFAGGTLLKQPEFARQVGARLRQERPGSRVLLLNREGAWGAVALARQLWERRPSKRGKASSIVGKSTRSLEGKFQLPQSTSPSPTELRNPRSANLDKLSTKKAVGLMLSEDARVPRAILAERARIARAIEWIAKSFSNGGRLFYVGAGTSGRLGVLDASECPPTFGVPPDMVQGIIAGGEAALTRSVEGAEDDFEAGAESIRERGVSRKDVVVGTAASGRTPFVWGALGEAHRRGVITILLCFNPALKIPKSMRPGLVIAPNVGPEVLTGSTRLKSGTATKLILNMFTTLAMVRMGKVMGNLMVDLKPGNSKLRDRAIRIVSELCGAKPAAASEALAESGWIVRDACVKLRRRRGNEASPAKRGW
jgi:N-acetylmuramic acid 6-phosphate etherase